LFLVKLNGIEDKDASDALRGTELYLNQEDLPELNEEEFFTADLKNLKVKDEENNDFGIVQNVFNFGAGDILEIVKDSGEYFMLTFTKESVPTIDIESGFIVINKNLAISNKGDISCIK
jgi:16S rRNA processing protein RimM